MGGERSSTPRKRLSGRICYSCKSPIPPPEKPGEQLCQRCKQANAPRRRVYMSFMLRQDWFCQFLEADCKTPLPRKLTFQDPAKIIELAERGGYGKSLEDRQWLEHAIEMGRGGIWLELAEEQYGKLLRP
jgi:hypothetical protein